MKLVIIESPYAGNVEENIKYAKACILDSLRRGEAPIASHLLYTQEGILRDGMELERLIGISAGHAWYRVAELCAMYTDQGVSRGMLIGKQVAETCRVVVEYRRIEGWTK